MISNQEQLNQASIQMGRLYEALASLRAQIEPFNAKAFALLAEGPLSQLRELQQEIDIYVGVAKVYEQEADIWLRLQGPEIVWGNSPSSVLTSFLDALRKGVQTIAEYDVTGRASTRPHGNIRRAADFQLVTMAPGSLIIGLKIPPAYVQPTLPIEGAPAVSPDIPRALAEFLEVVVWAASAADAPVIEGRLEDAKRRRLILSLAKAFVPRPRGSVENLEIYGRRVPGNARINIDRTAYERIDAAISRTAAQEQQTFIGTLREIDLDQKRFELRSIRGGGNDVSCEFDEDILETAAAALDHQIKVTGTLRRTGMFLGKQILKVSRLDVVDDGAA